MCKMVELKINTKYRVMGLPENVGRIENGDIVETTDIVQNLPFVGVVGITHPESAWIKKTFLFEMEKKPNCGQPDEENIWLALQQDDEYDDTFDCERCGGAYRLRNRGGVYEMEAIHDD